MQPKTAATKPRVTLDKIREGPVDLGRGVSVSAVMGESGKISFIRFTHPIKGGGTCTKGLPIRPKGIRGWMLHDKVWSLFVGEDRTITLSPSLVCDEHHVHGLLRQGRWTTFLDRFLEQDQYIIERKIDEAIKEAEEFGGGYWGAILANASKRW